MFSCLINSIMFWSVYVAHDPYEFHVVVEEVHMKRRLCEVGSLNEGVDVVSV